MSVIKLADRLFHKYAVDEDQVGEAPPTVRNPPINIHPDEKYWGYQGPKIDLPFDEGQRASSLDALAKNWEDFYTQIPGLRESPKTKAKLKGLRNGSIDPISLFNMERKWIESMLTNIKHAGGALDMLLDVTNDFVTNNKK